MSEGKAGKASILSDSQLQWFGDDWGAPICKMTERVPTPLGERCMSCGRAVTQNDQGLMIPHFRGVGDLVTREPWHIDCFMESVVGKHR